MRMLLLCLYLLVVKSAVSEETSSFLSNVLIKIQRERLGLLDNDVSSSNNKLTNDHMLEDDGTDYIYINDADDLINDLKEHHHKPEKLDYPNLNYGIANHEEENGGETATKLVKGNLSPPKKDGIYIYNDTIYLYKAPPNQQMPFDPPTSGVPLYNYKILHEKPPNVAGVQLEDSNPDDLIKFVMPEEEENTMKPMPSEIGGEDDKIAGYYYYYYPLDQVPPEFAEVVTNILSKPGRPIKPGMVIKPAKNPGMMPMMPMKMLKKPKQPVAPLFKAMAVFVGTAVAFIVSILLLPRVKLVKAKTLLDINTFNYLPESMFEEF